MSMFEQNREFYNRPIRLSKEQIQNPSGVIERFFSELWLWEKREIFAQLLECAMITDCEHFESPEQRASIITFLESLEEFIEAAYMLSEKRKSDEV